MRIIAILAACAAAASTVVPIAAQAQSSSSTTTTIETDINTMWAKLKGSWTQTKGAVKEQWGKLTDDDLMEIQGQRDQLVGKIQVRYGISQEQAEAQVSGWEHRRKSL